MSDEPLPESGSPQHSNSFPEVDWLLIETLGTHDGIEPTVVAEGSRKRNFAALSRQTRSRPVATALRDAVRAVVATRNFVDTTVPNKGSRTRILCEPIFSWLGDVHGVAAWIGPTDVTPPPRDIVGSFDWDASTLSSRHGPGLEEGVFGITGPTDPRAIPEIWKYFTEFDYHDDYTAFGEQVRSGDIESGQSFSAEIGLTGADNIPRRVHMTVRSLMNDDRRCILGLVHVLAHTEASPSAFSREFARAAVNIAVGNDDGIGHLMLGNGVVLDWLRLPAPPYDKWATQVPTFHEQSRIDFDAGLARLAAGEMASFEQVVYLKFDGTTFDGDDDWLQADVTVTAIGSGHAAPITQGLIQVRSSYSILAW